MSISQLPAFNQASVLVIGDVMLDRYWFGDASRISPEAPVPIVAVKHFDNRPGGAANVALNIAALGAHVTLIGLAGKDEAGDILAAQLASTGVNSKISYLDNVPTITKLRVVSRHQQLIRLDFEVKFQEQCEAIVQAYQAALNEVDVVVLSDYNKGTIHNSQQFIQMARDANVPILVDPKGNDFSIYRHANIITPNLKEFEAVAGSFKSEKELVEKGQKFLNEYQIDALLLTRGEKGMTLIQSETDELHLPAHAKEVFDVTGAGDTVIAVLAAALAADTTLPNAMTLANLAASLVVGKLGAASVSAAELQVAIADTNISSGVLNEEQLLLAVNEARKNGKRIVFTNGCFDVLHAGHVTYLQQAKQLGDYLIVAVNDDNSIKRLKGLGRPINNVEQRMAVLASLGVVDWVVPFADDTPNRLLKLLQPNILVKGGDYEISGVVGNEIVLAYGGEVRVLGVVKGISTTAIIDKMVQSVNLEGI